MSGNGTTMLNLETTGEVLQLAYSADGARLGVWARSSDAAPVVNWWDLSSGKPLRPTKLSGWPSHVAIAPQADIIAYLTGTGVYLIRPDDTYVGRGDSGVARRETFAITPDARLLAASGNYQQQPLQRSLIEIFRPNQPLTPVRFKSSLRVETLSFSAGGRFLSSAGDGGFTIWDLERGQGESIGAFLAVHARRIAFAPSGPTFASLHDWTFAMHDDPYRKLRWRILGTGPDHFTDLAFTPDGRTVAVACNTGSVEFHDAADGRQVRSFDWGIGPLRSITFSPDGLTCAAGSADGRIVVWDIDGD